jgi:hypothetical protein
MNSKKIFWFVFLLLILCVSCTDRKKELEVTMPGTNIPIQKMNSKIVLIDPSTFQNSHLNNDLLSLQIKNLTNTPIVFEKDFGVKIFTKQDQIWQQITNDIGYSNKKYLLQTDSLDPGGLVVVVIPVISNLHVPTTIRVVVIGLEKLNTSTESVGAYIDLPLKP